MSEANDWLWDILICPECGGPLARGSAESEIACGNQACGYRSRREGRLFDLLPRELDRHQAAEHEFRATVLERYAAAAGWLDASGLTQFQQLNILTNYPFTTQFAFFRDRFVKEHRLAGRGLEIGGATGEASGFIKLFYPDTEMVTCDVAPVNVRYGAQLADLLHLQTDYFVMADAERLPFRPASFDFLFSSGMLHHLGDIRRGLQKGYDTLKPGGRWYVVNELSIGSLFRLYWNSRWGKKGSQARERGVRENSYTFQEWQAFFEEQGFRILDSRFDRSPASAASWPDQVYYAIVSRLPIALIKMGIPCNVSFVLERA